MLKPIFFERNRVRRVYTGGKLFSELFGDAAEDGFFPEEWIASAVRAINKGSEDPKEGISRDRETGEYFDELLAKSPREMLGSREKLRILVKGLDSAIRLPAQAHPDKAFSRKYFHSEYGKTECWTVLATRPDAKIYFGFRQGVTKEAFEAAIDKSEHDPSAMEELMQTVTPQVGEVYLVPAKTVHAIGAGCLILEVQEPTDFTVQPERYCGDYRLSDEEMYLGLPRNVAVECFCFEESPAPRLEGAVTEQAVGMRKEALVTEKDTDCFLINRIVLTNGCYTPALCDSYGIYIVTDGEGEIVGEGYRRALKKGDYFFLPASAMGGYTLHGTAEVIECY